VNFGVAPAIILYTWGLLPIKGFGWIAVLLFACAMGLRLARFNAMLEVDKPRWMSNYFTGMPAPAGAITVLLPIYIHELGLVDVKAYPAVIAVHAIAMACLLISTLPTFSGKLLGERIPREVVPPILIGVAAVVGLLVTYPFPTLTVLTIVYLALIPVSVMRYRRHLATRPTEVTRPPTVAEAPRPLIATPPANDQPTKH
jgi:CDP-diacylglycerol--serine O-phosphatidyltransferase